MCKVFLICGSTHVLGGQVRGQPPFSGGGLALGGGSAQRDIVGVVHVRAIGLYVGALQQHRGLDVQHHLDPRRTSLNPSLRNV
jgi:hypothetical protein